MAVDASIYSQIAQPRPVNRLAQYANVAQIQGLQQQNALASMKMDEMRRASEDDQALRADLAAPGADPYNALLKRGRVKEANEFQKGQTERAHKEAETKKIDFEMAIKKAEYGASVLSTARDQASYDQARQVLAQTFGEKSIANMPPQFDPAYVQAEAAKGMTYAQKLTDERARQQQAETARHNKVTETNSAGQLRVSQGNLNLRQKEFDLNSGNAVAEAGGPSQAALTKQFGKAPAGYRWLPDGKQEAIPGGPADIKAGEAGAKREAATRGGISQAERVISKVDEALGRVGRNSAGLGGSVMAKLPGTEATDLRADLETIKANLGFAELQAMREASPTGGALGAIAVQELIALQSTVASLDPSQSPAKLKSNLEQVRKHYQNWKATLEGRLPDGSGKPAAPAVPPAAEPQAGAFSDAEKERRYQEWKAKQK
jgi:hypothetical protein